MAKTYKTTTTKATTHKRQYLRVSCWCHGGWEFRRDRLATLGGFPVLLRSRLQRFLSSEKKIVRRAHCWRQLLWTHEKAGR